MFSPRGQLSSTLLENSPILASRIPLPPNPIIQYLRFTSAEAQAEHGSTVKAGKSVDAARVWLVGRNTQEKTGMLQRLLPSVDTDDGYSCLYVFAVTAIDQSKATRKTLTDLHFEGLTGESPSYIWQQTNVICLRVNDRV